MLKSFLQSIRYKSVAEKKSDEWFLDAILVRLWYKKNGEMLQIPLSSHNARFHCIRDVKSVLVVLNEEKVFGRKESSFGRGESLTNIH